MGAKGTAHVARQAGRSSLDDYDPTDSRTTEVEAMYREITRLREKLSKDRLELHTTQKRYDQLKTEY